MTEELKIFRIAIFCVCFSVYPFASASSFFDVESVEVAENAKGSDVVIAKKKAHRKAIRKAFEQLLLDVSREQSVAFSDQEISDCEYDHTVLNEKVSDLSYMCKMSYRFDKKSVLLLLERHKIPVVSECFDQVKSSDNKKRTIDVVMSLDDYINQYYLLQDFGVKVGKLVNKVAIVSMNKEAIDFLKSQNILYSECDSKL